MIGIVAKNELDCEYYKGIIGNVAAVRIFHSLDALKQNHAKEAFLGFVVDSRAVVSGSPEEKQFFGELEKSFPVLRVTINPLSQKCTGVVHSSTMSEHDAFRWLFDQCSGAKPKAIRNRRRRPVFLNLTISTGLSTSEKEAIRANTADASDEGMFIVSLADKKPGDRVFVTVRDFSDSTPIEGEVRWCLPWGASSHHLPGFGIQITKMSTVQISELDSHCDRVSIR
ncbi:MAG: hypothetical protein A2428_02385 [Bdellovibrionales bacterium RIFOXYC1_FULL_54_43]|nr:MAG: hypothetical protein A2428_02385 [Bdellovibrionales bacterium RIFOXYC1_FULL_54_43]OFZ84697.1 MAG: hypothetical protein A2603_13850 [Bdellovibrionales bacterium RIFOXYD1_FULL_55_31]